MRTRPYGESDKIVTFLSHDFGKLTGIAKGAKNSRRRFANCLDPLTRVRVHFRSRIGATLVFMDLCDLLVPARALAEPKKLAYGSYLLELVDQLTEEAHPVPEIYRLLVDGVEELGVGPATAAFLRVFELQLLGHAGYDPQLTQCASCQRSLDAAEAVYYDALQSSFLCETCRAGRPSLIEFRGATLQALTQMKTQSVHAARTHRFSPTVAHEAAQLLGYLMAPHLPRPLRSVKLIAALA